MLHPVQVDDAEAAGGCEAIGIYEDVPDGQIGENNIEIMDFADKFGKGGNDSFLLGGLKSTPGV